MQSQLPTTTDSQPHMIEQNNDALVFDPRGIRELPLTRLGWNLILICRWAALIVALIAATVPGLFVWAYMLVRAVVAFGLGTALAFCTRSTPPDTARLDYLATFWIDMMNSIIARILRPGDEQPARSPLSLAHPTSELLGACIFWFSIASTIAYFSEFATFVRSFYRGLRWILTTIFSLPGTALEQINRLVGLLGG